MVARVNRVSGNSPPRFRAGMRSIPARMLNQLSDLASEYRGTNKTQQPKKGGRHNTYRLIVVSVQQDYLICNAPGESEAINVALPYLLRRTPFDGLTRDGITYTYSSNTVRSATGSPGTETQTIVPSYVANDQIFATRYPRYGTGVTNVFFIDENRDGRAWAKQAG